MSDAFLSRALNPQQRAAAEQILGPVLILAGAGTGKTKTLTFRIAHMVHKGVSPRNILAVTFTNKAAREMLGRVNALLPRRDANGEKPERPTLCTFHSLCARILRLHIEKLGYKRNFVIFDEAEQISAMKKILSTISTKGEKIKPRDVLAVLSRLKNGGAQAAVFADENLRALAERIRKRYESSLRACNAVDFDDLILLVLRLFKEHPDALASCRTQYRYVMVDEYQDTNAAQFELVHSLTVEHRNLCVVGDDDQSIYGWRGAEVANLLDLEKHYPEVKVIKLEQNYRSTNTILAAANAVIKNNPRRRAKQLWSQKGAGSKIRLAAFVNDEEEAKVVVEEIEADRLVRRVVWSEQAILFRTNIQSRAIETALRKAGVRYHLVGGQSFFDRREVRDLLAYLKVFINPHDDVSLLRIANVPTRGLSDVSMERLLAASQERQCSVFAAMRHTDVREEFQTRTREAIGEFVAFIERTRAVLATEGTLSLAAWADRFLVEIGYLDELRRGEKNLETAENRVRNLKDLVATLDGDSAALSPADRLQNFLEMLTLDSERAEEKELAGDAVTLITMHSCKGLEFSRVHIVGLEEGLLPHSRSKVEGTLDEERRLFYVGITRAKEMLTISHCAGRSKYGQLMPCHPSQFLKELPPELIEDCALEAKKPLRADDGLRRFAAWRESQD